VGDVVDANVKALTTGYCGGVNIATSTETDVNRVYALLAKNLGVATPAKYGPERLGEQRRSVLANAKAKAGARLGAPGRRGTRHGADDRLVPASTADLRRG